MLNGHLHTCLHVYANLKMAISSLCFITKSFREKLKELHFHSTQEPYIINKAQKREGKHGSKLMAP